MWSEVGVELVKRGNVVAGRGGYIYRHMHHLQVLHTEEAPELFKHELWLFLGKQVAAG